MGAENWVLVALVVVLTVYLLPTLIGRREVMRLSRAEDRYSGELRVLSRGAPPPAGAVAADTGHAILFSRRPEVKAMNRPAVRNVRALRVERELARARRVHDDARAVRKQAASRRGAVAAALLGISVAAILVTAFTALPAWIAAVPAALLVANAAIGHRASTASRRAEAAERRRIRSLEQELARLTGAAGAVAKERAGLADVEPAATARRSVEPSAATDHEEAQRPAPVAVDAAATPVATESSSSSAPVEESEARAAEPTTATPPQGWRPVAVPAPTYTLAARAPRREVAPLEDAAAPSAAVPARPTSVRTFPEPDVDEVAFHPIDLDAVLERRRAAGE